MKQILFFALLCLALSACAVDPRKQAEADAIRMAAESAAAQDAQSRKFAQEVHDQNMDELEQTEAERVAAEKARLLAEAEKKAAEIAARKRLIVGSSIAGVVALFAVILISAYIYYRATMTLQQAFAVYSLRRAEVLANVIPLDSKTGLFPLVMHRLGDGRYTLTNPNVGSVMLLDMRRAEDRQMVAASHSIQFAGVLAQNAKNARDAASLAMINPPVIGANAPGLQVGLPLGSFMAEMIPARSRGRKLSQEGDEQ